MGDQAMFNLKGRVALVTGAGQGVGRAIALGLARNGAGGIIVNDFYAERALAVADELRALGVRAEPMVADVTDLPAIHAALAACVQALGPVEILVNNAGNGGAQGYPPELPLFWDTDPARWRRFVEVNLYGVMNCCHAILPGMVERSYGRVVTITSDASRAIEPRQADYAAAKAGAAGFMRGLAADAARFGITANCVAIATIMPAMDAPQLDAFLASDQSKRQLARYPIRRYGQPDDIVGMTVLLCSDAAGWITGQTYPVNGGYSPAL